jgi:uncharacterized membrane protein SirB2
MNCNFMVVVVVVVVVMVALAKQQAHMQDKRKYWFVRSGKASSMSPLNE